MSVMSELIGRGSAGDGPDQTLPASRVVGGTLTRQPGTRPQFPCRDPLGDAIRHLHVNVGDLTRVNRRLL